MGGGASWDKGHAQTGQIFGKKTFLEDLVMEHGNFLLGFMITRIASDIPTVLTRV